MTSIRRQSILKASRFDLLDCDSLLGESTSGLLQAHPLFAPPRKAVAGGRLKPNARSELSVGVCSGQTTARIGVLRRGTRSRVSRQGGSARAFCSCRNFDTFQL